MREFPFARWLKREPAASRTEFSPRDVKTLYLAPHYFTWTAISTPARGEEFTTADSNLFSTVSLYPGQNAGRLLRRDLVALEFTNCPAAIGNQETGETPSLGLQTVERRGKMGFDKNYRKKPEVTSMRSDFQKVRRTAGSTLTATKPMAEELTDLVHDLRELLESYAPLWYTEEMDTRVNETLARARRVVVSTP